MGYQRRNNFELNDNSYTETIRRLARAMSELGRGSEETANMLAEFNKYINSQSGTGTTHKTENPNQKNDLEILNRIEISNEFLNLKIDN